MSSDDESLESFELYQGLKRRFYTKEKADKEVQVKARKLQKYLQAKKKLEIMKEDFSVENLNDKTSLKNEDSEKDFQEEVDPILGSFVKAKAKIIKEYAEIKKLVQFQPQKEK